ncbi:hypothetical protein ABT033_21500 [Streptomyces pharetrae]|uniref:hypothetical protein n=1 Tax=Streptomyces pharetrae TaxID=291370 RepID=UPI00334EFBDC
MAFSRGGRTAITAGRDGTEVERRRPLAPGGTGLTDRALGRDRGDLPALAPGTIVTLSNDQAVVMWKHRPVLGTLPRLRHVRVPLSRAQWSRRCPGLDHRPP